jgi:hypothetical protein
MLIGNHLTPFKKGVDFICHTFPIFWTMVVKVLIAEWQLMQPKDKIALYMSLMEIPDYGGEKTDFSFL